MNIEHLNTILQSIDKNLIAHIVPNIDQMFRNAPHHDIYYKNHYLGFYYFQDQSINTIVWQIPDQTVLIQDPNLRKKITKILKHVDKASRFMINRDKS